MEDRLATLKNVIGEPELNGWNLYLGKIPLYFLPLVLQDTAKWFSIIAVFALHYCGFVFCGTHFLWLLICVFD